MSPPIETVAGRYRLLSLVGKGGMGSVWRGEHATLHTPVAIKLLDPRLAEKEEVKARFLREARAAASLRSKHVVQILDHGIESGFPYIVMELLRGESLGDRLSREKKLEPEVVARIFTEMGLAIARAHKSGIVHRDLKPDNVFLAEVEADDAGSGAGAWTVKVVDFGVAKLMDESLPGEVSTSTGTMIGTPHYMSPE
ncbi:MAG: serine/threonine protein kinase [Polyangiaceae bacterium]|nr:serine/threonine protein kinase [Polyangiaceae bacterium]